MARWGVRVWGPAAPGHPLDGGGNGRGHRDQRLLGVQRIWRAHKLQPHRVRSFKLSTDPQFVARLRDIAGLYIDPAVEGFFANLTKRRLQRGVFRSIAELQAAINRFIEEANHDPKSLVWTADPDKIIAAVNGHQALDPIH